MKLISKLISILLITQSFVWSQNYFKIVLDEGTTLNSVFDVLIEAGALNYGSYSSASGAQYAVNVTNIDVDIVDASDHNLELSVSLSLYADLSIGNGLFSNNHNLTLDMEYEMTSEYDPIEKNLSLFADLIYCDIGNIPDWFEHWLDYQFQMFDQIPIVELFNIYPELNEYYFSEPIISFTNDAVIVSVALNDELLIANRSVDNPSGFLDGTLSINNITTPALTQSNIVSPSNVLARLNDQYIASTNNIAINDEIHWGWNTANDYKLKTNQLQLTQQYFTDGLTAWFDDQEAISIGTTIDDFGDVNFKIHDPWFVENPESDPEDWIQPDNFRPISPRQYQVFLNQNEEFLSDQPIYTLKAPNLYATENAIYQFERWHGSNIKFNVAGATETNDRITDVVFLNGQASVTAEYIVVNDQPSVYQVPEGDELVIPPGANIDLAESFKIEVDGSIIMDGGNSFIRLNGNLDEPWAGIQVNETGNIKIDNVIVYYAETALTLNVFNLDGIIDHTISDFHVYNSTIGIDIITGNIFLTSDWEQGEYTPLNIVNCEFGGIINTAIRWKPDNAFYQFGKINVTGSHFMYVENGIEINGMDIYNDYYGSSEISYNLFSHCTFPINITTPSRGEYYWYPTLVVPEPQEWSDVYDPEYALKNIISYNQFYYYETALKVDGDVLLLTHHNLYDGESSQNSTAIDLKAYTEPPLHDPCNLHSHIIGNETIVNNSLGIKAMITNDGNRVNCYTMIVDNSIFYENGDNIDSPGSDIHADHQRNMILEDDPMFVGENNYHLSPGSPAIDGGIDMDYNLDGVADLDPDGSPLDMGAYYYQLPSTNLSFDPNMQVGDFPMFGWTPVNNAGDVYYDIYFHGQIVQPGDPFTYLTTTQTTSYMDIRYIVAEIEEGGNGGNDRQVKVRKNEQTPPEQEVIEIYYTVVVRDAESHLSPSSNEIMARVIRAPNHKEMDEELLPEKYDLSQGFPNPFNPAITLPYALPDLSTVVIHVYDITGRRVATLKNEMEEAGYYRIRWNGKNMSNIPLPSGMYIIQMTAKSMEDGELFTKVQKVLLMK